MMTDSTKFMYSISQYIVEYPSTVLTGSVHNQTEELTSLYFHFSHLHFTYYEPILYYICMDSVRIITICAIPYFLYVSKSPKGHFLTTLTCLHAQPSHTQRNKLLFKFHSMEEAKLHNASILTTYDYDISRAITAQSNSQISFGSEFRNPSSGSHFSFISVTTSTSHNGHRDRGDHKSTIKHREMLDKAIQEDITTCFALPLPIDIIHLIPNASLAPLGCIEQEINNERGEHISKYRMTHNQSFPGPSSSSVNKQVIKEALPSCMYSFVLLGSPLF